jgi:ketosteroid isomerase-like protein
MKRIVVLCFCLGLLALAGGQPATAGAPPPDEAIAAANVEYLSLINAKAVDAEKLAAQFSDDAFLLIPTLELVTGRTAIEQSIAQSAAQISDISLKTTRVKSSGNLAFEIGTWSSSIDERRSVGNYLTLWRQVGETWLRAGSCSVPESGANPVIFGNPGQVFGAAASGSGSLRLIGGEGAAEAASTIQGLTSQYAEVFNSGEGGAVRAFSSSLYATDAVVMLPEATLLEGSELIAVACELAAAAVSNVGFDVSAIEVGAGGDLAFLLATYRNDVRSEKGEIIPAGGNYLAVWSREGGQWKIAASCTGDTGGTPEIGYTLRSTSP